ncbi:MAG: glycoside hydrolase family 78 protein [Chthonomonas sp.]|nr:glycoside hydrolase family 78 protein [Chthonomonas sp.]
MLAIVSGLLLMSASGSIFPASLRCEGLSEPIGIGLEPPRVSWKLQAQNSADKNLRQTAYRVVVSGPKGVLYDSQRVTSAETFGIKIPMALATSAAYTWRVQVWDQDGRESELSKSAHFATTDLAAGERLPWISARPVNPPTANFEGANWIWSAGADETVTFIKDFSAKSGETATLSLTADDQVEAFLNGERVAASDGNIDAWRRPLFASLNLHAQNQLKIVARNEPRSSSGMIARVDFSDGRNPLLSDKSWLANGSQAREIAAYGSQPWGRVAGRLYRPAMHYRRELQVRKGLVRASLTATALGLIDIYCNGRRVTNDLFTPGWTDYERRIYTRTHDVTKLIKTGANAIGAIVGDGWYAGYLGYSGTRAHYGDRPAMAAKLTLQYEDGSTETLTGDEAWRVAAGGTIRQDFLAGETMDARREPSGWSRAGFDDADWAAPEVISPKAGALEPFPAEPVRVYDEVEPISIRPSGDGKYIVDFGQNLAGFARLRLRAKPGQVVSMKFVEVLNRDGTIYTANLRGAEATDVYIAKGEGTEVWEPRFTFHGFRYIQVSGLDRAPTKATLTALAISSATPEVGRVETSDPMLNKLAKNAWWTQKMNFIDVPTDCPQRDERLGWTGDAQAYIRTASYYSHVESFFNKWNTTLDDAQRADGQFPMVAPLKVAESDGGPAWADAGVICPWTSYEFYGDRERLAEHYPQMVKFVEFCLKRSKPNLLPPDQFHCFGDWVSHNADTPNDVIYLSYFAGSARIVAQAADVLGKASDAAKYDELADRLRDAFAEHYSRADGWVKGDTQCSYVLALVFDLLPADRAAKAAERLVADIEKRNWHLSTGFVGTRDLMHVLTKVGRSDVALRLLHNKTFPSWGFSIENGATTIWERWDGWTPENGFQTPVMNSFAHYAYGAVMGWVFENIGGIRTLEPGFGVVQIAPVFDPKLNFARTTYDSIRGPILTDWRRVGGKIKLTVTLPPNTRGEVKLPQGTKEVGSGKWEFEVDA